MIKVKGNDTIKDFKIHKYQVTQKKFEKVMGYNPSYFKGDNLPVERVTWYDAVMYCNKLSEKKGIEKYYSIEDIKRNENTIIEAKVTILGGNGYRLPTDEEWEFAAKGGNHSKGYEYSGSNDIDEVAWYSGNSEHKTHPVGEKRSNELEIYDMTGNVFEWTETEYGSSSRYNRGGSWYYSAYLCKIGNQNYNNANFRDNGLGFRVCRS